MRFWFVLIVCTLTLEIGFADGFEWQDCGAEMALNSLDRLIKATECTLVKQREVRQMILEYGQIREQVIQNQNDRALMTRLIKIAHQLHENIQENFLSDLFEVDFLQELSFFSRIASKKSLPKP